MRLVSYRSEDGPRAGILRGDEVFDAWGALGEQRRAGLRELIAEGGIERLQSADAGAPVADPELLAPVTDPEKIVCIGLNYRSHAAEAGIDPPSSPTFFAKYRNALAEPGATVPLPATSEKVDYEAEVAFVIGHRARDVGEDRALDHVAGYTLFNDLSARDLQFSTPQWMPGKVFDGSAPCGPALVTPDEAGPHDAIELALELNGETMQSASTADLIFSIPQLVAHLSALMTLEPGDLVSTGTPSGVGSVREPRVWLMPGDVVSTGTPAGVGSTRQPRVWLKPGDEIAINSPTLGRLETRIG